RKRGHGDVLSTLATVLKRWGLAQPVDQTDPELPPFQGGMIGFFGYDLAPQLERLPRRHLRDSRLPDIRLALYDTAVIIDARSGTAELWGWDLTDEGDLATQNRCRAWYRLISQSLKMRANRARRSRSDGLTSPITRERYVARVRRVLDYI